jgi:hypothetical protein
MKKLEESDRIFSNGSNDSDKIRPRLRGRILQIDEKATTTTNK